MNEDGLFPVRQLLNWALYWAARGMPPTEGYTFTSEWVEERLDVLLSGLPGGTVNKLLPGSYVADILNATTSWARIGTAYMEADDLLYMLQEMLMLDSPSYCLYILNAVTDYAVWKPELEELLPHG